MGKVMALATDPRDGLARALVSLGRAFMARELVSFTGDGRKWQVKSDVGHYLGDGRLVVWNNHQPALRADEICAPDDQAQQMFDRIWTWERCTTNDEAIRRSIVAGPPAPQPMEPILELTSAREVHYAPARRSIRPTATLFVDIDQARVVFATEGKDADTIAAFADDLAAHGGCP